MAKFNLIGRILGSLAQTKRGTESVVKFGRTSDEPTTHLASRASQGTSHRHPRVDWLPRCTDLTDAVGRLTVLPYEAKQASSCMNVDALRTGRSAA
jgi:hypothetical protein